MKLLSAELKSFGRFESAKINLAGKLIAIVGPNEAGKTTLLRSLAHLTSGKPRPAGLKSRPVVSSDPTYVSANYEVEPADLEGFLQLSDLRHLPAVAELRRIDDKQLSMTITPTPAYDMTPLKAAISQIHRFVASKAMRELASFEPADPDNPDQQDSEALDLREALAALQNVLEFIDTEPPFGNSDVQEAAELASPLFEWSVAQHHSERFDVLKEWLGRESIQKLLIDHLWSVTPKFALFEDTDRLLAPSYEVDDDLVASSPRALRNLLALADVTLPELLAAVESDEIGAGPSLLARANKKLSARFSETWNQADLAVYLDLQGSTLNIMIRESGDIITGVDERSSGLRSFIALITFVESNDPLIPPVLLIDEAEQHLHIDAQAELIDMLEAQRQASKIIYTTHSPACLPTDLGARVRVVEPIEKNGAKSRVRNNFWVSGSPGFSPLMMAMGAGAAAFTPARRAVLAEGATEMILLPRLLRDANNLDALFYQVAPGLSEAPKRIFPELDLQAARVAYLVDGDPAGSKLKEGLLAAGVKVGSIVTSAAQLELFVDSESFRRSVNHELSIANPHSKEQLPRLASSARWAFVEQWCGSRNLRVPSKVAIACRLVEDPEPIVSSALAGKLRDLHERIVAIVGTPID